MCRAPFLPENALVYTFTVSMGVRRTQAKWPGVSQVLAAGSSILLSVGSFQEFYILQLHGTNKECT